MVVQAIVVNLAPVLFIPMRTAWGLTFEQLGRLILVNFATQVSCDLIAGAAVSRIGARRLLVGGHLAVAIGLGLFAWLPELGGSPYAGLMLGTILFSMGGGVLELLLSPVIHAIPSDRKAADMSLLHSFYAWGQAGVILLTAVAVFVGGARPWVWIAPAWALLPLLGAWVFGRAPLPPFPDEARRHRLRDLLRVPAFLGLVLAMVLAGASEIAMAQWMSAFAERALGLPKLLGDLGGLVLFAVGLGAGRAAFGLARGNRRLGRTLQLGAFLAVLLYGMAALSPVSGVSLAACALSGAAVSLMWPGVLALASARFPLAGATMFAVLAAAGDMGCATAPWLVGWVADRAGQFAAPFRGAWSPESWGLRLGLLAALPFPALFLLLVRSLTRELADPRMLESTSRPSWGRIPDHEEQHHAR